MFAFNLNLRRYVKGEEAVRGVAMVGPCRMKPVFAMR